jgi:hypothetical protein
MPLKNPSYGTHFHGTSDTCGWTVVSRSWLSILILRRFSRVAQEHPGMCGGELLAVKASNREAREEIAKGAKNSFCTTAETLKHKNISFASLRPFFSALRG